MTDPIQGGNPPQQGWSAVQTNQQDQQQYYDDILGGEDIFVTNPEMEDYDLPYGDVLEKKYQFEPITEEEPILVSTASATPTSVVENIPDLDPIVEEEMQTIQQQAGLETAKVETLLDTKLQTDIQKKFGELFFMTKRIYELKDKLWISEETFDVLWADNDKVFILYRFLLDASEPIVFITKIEQNKETSEESENELRFSFNEETSSIEVMVNNTLLFDEIQDFTADPKKKIQVSEKLNKFIFLTSEEQKKLEKEIQNKEEEERKKRKLQDIFRNF